ncbi:MAG: hypothetical protein AAF213_05030 [Pseudomonadota bacterium]
MLLSELVEKDEVSTPAIYGVEVDVESFTPPAKLEEISLIYKADGADIDEALMDVIISYGLAGIEVILEIPAEADDIDAKYLVSVAANAGFSLSLLPPKEPSEEADTKYFARLTDFSGIYLTQNNFGKFIAPVTNYLEYLFVELLRGPEAPFEVNDPYIKERLVELTNEDFVTAFKDSLRQDFYNFFGGQEEFERFARRMMMRIHSFSDECVNDIVGHQANQNTEDNDGKESA